MSPSSEYHLIYWPGLPGRGEHIRLAFEEAGVPYSDTARQENGAKEVLALMSDSGDKHNPPSFASPALRHGDLVISQTPNVLMYLGEQLGDKLVPKAGGADAKWHVNALALTALDGLSNEAHDCHHPIATGLFYEDQKVEALRRTKIYVKERLPKYLAYFERVLSSPASGDGPWLYAGQLSYADLVLFQTVDGLKYMFPKAMAKYEASGKFDKVFKLHEAVQQRPGIKAYLASDRRHKYSNGVYRYYEELDVEE